MKIPIYPKPKLDKDLKLHSPESLAKENKEKYGTKLTNEIINERDKNLKSMNNKEKDQLINYQKEQLGYPKKQTLSQRINSLIKK